MRGNVVELVRYFRAIAVQAFATATTVNGTGVDVSAAEDLMVTADVSALTGTTPTITIKLQHSDTLGGTYTDIAGAAFPLIGSGGLTHNEKYHGRLSLRQGVKKFVRATFTTTGTTPGGQVSVGFLLGRNSETPVTQPVAISFDVGA